MEVNIQEKSEFYARLTIKKLEEMDVRGDSWNQFHAGNKNENSALIKKDRNN